MSVGTIKWLNPRAGYGLIAPDDGSTDLWVDLPAEAACLFESGQRVRYQVLTPDWGRPVAVNLRRVDDGPAVFAA